MKSSKGLSEYLTKEQARLFYLARQERGPDKQLARTWTFRGQVYVARSRLSKGTLIRNEAELREFLELPLKRLNPYLVYRALDS